MKESFHEKNQTTEGSLESLSEAEQERLKQSWLKVENLLADLEKISIKEASVSKVEGKDKEALKATSQEIYDFYSNLFEGEENADPMQIEIGIENGIVDTYIARDPEGKIASLLQSQRVEIVSSEKEGKPELMFLVWYVGTDKNYKGKPLTRDLFRLAIKDLVEKSKSELKPIKAFVGETEDEVEGLFNRYGLNRIYYKDSRGETSEVPFEAPPEDESEDGVPEHLMVRLLDDRKTMSVHEIMEIVDSIYAQYTRPEYFSAEYLKYAREFYKEELNLVERNMPITQLTADVYRRSYSNVVANIREKLEKSLNKVDGDLFFKSRRERRMDE